MTSLQAASPAMVLVDDDFYSARLLTRMLASYDAPAITVIANADEALDQLSAIAAHTAPPACTLVLVDLKSSSAATRDFVSRLTKAAPQLVVAAMAPTLDRDTRNALLDAGASAVFERHADHALYLREAASIVSFWVRSQHLDAVGA